MVGPIKIPSTGPSTPYNTPDGRNVSVVSTMGILFSDDFGGNAIDTTKWQILSGGYPGIGTGTNAAIAAAVASSALTVSMNTTNADDYWLLSQQIFAGAEDVLVVLSKSQSLVANSIFIGLVEVDANGNPIVNPNLAGDFQNRGGVEFGGTVTTTAYVCQAVADASNAVAVGLIGTAGALTGTQEFEMEFHSEDIICSSQAVDALLGKLATGSRVSTQCPNDGKAYKLLMRFHNTAGPASNTSVVIQRVLVVSRHEMRVEVASGRGDTNTQKAIAVNIVSGSVNLSSNSQGVGSVTPVANATVGGNLTSARLTSAATTNATSVKASGGIIYGGQVINTGTSAAFLKLYNKATAPVVGTDTPVVTIMLPATLAATDAVPVNIADIVSAIGYKLSAGIAFAITGAYADADTTAIAAGQVNLQLFYI